MKTLFFLVPWLAAWPTVAQLAPPTLSLAEAAARGDTAAMAADIARGESVDVQNPHGWTPLVYAIREGKMEAVRLLLAKHANPNILTVAGCSPLDFAVEKAHADIIRLLLDAGADPNGFRTPLQDGSHCSALCAAIGQRRPDLVEILLDHGARINDASETGLTALIRASAFDNVEQVQLLLRRGADTHASYKDDDGHSHGPLEVAAGEGRPYVLEALTDAGVKPVNVKNALNEDLNAALNQDDYEHVQGALARGASATEPDSNNVLPLTVAILEFDPAIVEMLIKAGADVNANPDGDPRHTPLAFAQGQIAYAKTPQQAERARRIIAVLTKAGAIR